jgi:hypothetical protein
LHADIKNSVSNRGKGRASTRALPEGVVAITGGSGAETVYHFEDDPLDFDPNWAVEESSLDSIIVDSDSMSDVPPPTLDSPSDAESMSDVRPPTLGAPSSVNGSESRETDPPVPRRRTPGPPSKTKERWSRLQTDIFHREISRGNNLNSHIALLTGKTVEQVQEKKKTENRRGRILGKNRTF